MFVHSVVDAWGKIPSGILNGNFYEFGAFPQCFDLKDVQKPETQYCISQLNGDWSTWSMYTYQTMEETVTSEVIIPHFWLTIKQKWSLE